MSDLPMVAEVMKQTGMEVADLRAGEFSTLGPKASKVRSSFLEADYRLAAGLKLDVNRAAETMQKLWGDRSPTSAIIAVDPGQTLKNADGYRAS